MAFAALMSIDIELQDDCVGYYQEAIPISSTYVVSLQ
jgi:hypothetical protein